MSDQASPLIVCKSCGNSFHGNYCNECGEKVLKPADRSFKTFLSNILIAITFADSKMIKTLWLVLSKPGFVSKEFAEGRRVNYLKPISLFFVLNLIYFFFPLIQLFNATLTTQLSSPWGFYFKNVIAHKMVDMGLNLPSFQLIYHQKTVGFAKLMVMVFVVIASLPLNILYWKRNRFFTDHVGYMVELACFNLFVNAITLSILAFFGLGKYLNEEVLTFIFISTNLYFLLRSGNIFYQEKSWKLVLKSVLMIAFLKIALEVYRAILFFVTIWSM
ncbi:MAG: DUF3667 domain-containing protein [Cyclobacteriaceae bacterium]|jgi:hypothetical protein|nr:DUF3667 domain-containing protein [Flammeovirgaceae bacterium]